MRQNAERAPALPTSERGLQEEKRASFDSAGDGFHALWIVRERLGKL
jgi:hypothetical protein